MKLIIFLCCLLITLSLRARESYYATESLQKKNPYAFALTGQSHDFHKMLSRSAPREREKLIKAIKSNRKLLESIADYERLSIGDQKLVLKKIFDLEVRTLGIKAPQLVFGKSPSGRSVFFDFDPKVGGPGKVYISVEDLRQGGHPYDSLSLLIHETRHSAQFQLAQKGDKRHPLVRGFTEAFLTQKEIFQSNQKISFCDFASLLNEYEAFQYSNYVLNRLSEGKIDITDMGTLASQYNQHGKLKLDILKLMKVVPESQLIHRFNGLVKVTK